MTIYFEDGKLTKDNGIPAPGYCFIDATEGPSTCEFRLRHEAWEELTLDMASVVYTNYLGAMDGTYSWDKDKGYHDLYLRDKEGKWRLIQTFTEKELRMPHRIPHMYLAGTFEEEIIECDGRCLNCDYYGTYDCPDNA